MPLIQGLVTVPAGGVNENLLAGSQFEFLPFDAELEIGLMGDANGAFQRVDAYSGQDALCEGISLGVANRTPVYPDDFALTDVAAAGERLKVRVRNTAAAAANVFFSVRIAGLRCSVSCCRSTRNPSAISRACNGGRCGDGFGCWVIWS